MFNQRQSQTGSAIHLQMNEKQIKSKSKFLSLVLRHQPQTIGIDLDEAGWVSVETLLAAMRKRAQPLSRADLEMVVATNDKQRFEFSEDGQLLRARQGHSLNVSLGYESTD